MSFMISEIDKTIKENKDFIEEKSIKGAGLAFSGIVSYLSADVAIEYIKNNITSLNTPAFVLKLTGFIDNTLGSFGFKNTGIRNSTINDITDIKLPIETKTLTYALTSFQTLSAIITAYGIGRAIFSFIENFRDFTIETQQLRKELKTSKPTSVQINNYNKMQDDLAVAAAKAKQEIAEITIKAKTLKLEIDELEKNRDDLTFEQLKELEEKNKKLIAYGTLLKKLQDITNTTTPY